MGLRVTELVGLLSIVAALGLVIGASFMLSVLAGMFTLAGVLFLAGGGLLIFAGWREAKAKELGQHVTGNGLRSAA